MKKENRVLRGGVVDALGIFLSIACAIHCLALPVLMGVLPLIGMEFFMDHEFEHVMMAIIFLVAGFTLYRGFRVHKRLSVMVAFVVGMIAFLLVRPSLPEQLHSIATLIGGMAFIAGHWMNWKFGKEKPGNCPCSTEFA